MADRRLKVALCDDHAVVRAGLRRILSDEPDFEVVGECGTAEAAVAMAAALQPDVFVLDLGLADSSGLAAIEPILRATRGVRVLILTMYEDVEYARQAFAAGATGYLPKDAADIELVAAVRSMATGNAYVHPTVGAALAGVGSTVSDADAPLKSLSPRELETLRLIALGHTNHEIGDQLHVSVRTVESHRSRIHQKLGIRNRAELVRFARAAGLF